MCPQERIPQHKLCAVHQLPLPTSAPGPPPCCLPPAGSAQQRGAGRAGSGASPSSAGAGKSERDFWAEFAQEAAKGWKFAGSGPAAGATSSGGARQRQQARHARQQPPAAAAAAEAVAAGSLEEQVRAELAAALEQARGDLLRFVAALGIEFERASDRRSALRNARSAALQRLHPDKLMQQGEREQMRGMIATQMLNELWLKERGRRA